MSVLHHAVDRAALEARGMALVRHLGGHWTAGKGMCRCPAHPDRSPSLSVRTGDIDLLFKCFAGCDTIDVLRTIARLGPLPTAGPLNSYNAHSGVDDGWLRSRATDLWEEAGIALAGAPLASIDFEAADDVIIALEDGAGTVVVDTVYPALGSDINNALAIDIGVALSDCRCIATDEDQRTNLPGCYAAGDVVAGLDQISVATGHGAKAATAIHNALRALDGQTADK